MENNKSLSIFLLILGGGFSILGTQFGILYSAISSLSFIIWGLIFLDQRKKAYISLK